MSTGYNSHTLTTSAQLSVCCMCSMVGNQVSLSVACSEGLRGRGLYRPFDGSDIQCYTRLPPSLTLEPLLHPRDFW